MRKLILLFFLFQLFLGKEAFAEVPADFDYKSDEFKAVASQFFCNCGCGQDHYECDPNTCGNTREFKKELAERMLKGWTPEQIRDYYVNMFGEEILMAPQKKGFSLTAWVTPFVVLSAGGGGLFLVMRRWVGRNQNMQEEQSEEAVQQKVDETENEILKSMIDEERKKYL